MTAYERRQSFAEAFVAQARSDWRIYRILAAQGAVERVAWSAFSTRAFFSFI